MAILSDEQTQRIRGRAKRHNQPFMGLQIAARQAEMLKAAARADWRESLRQRATVFYQDSVERNLEWTVDFDHAMVIMTGSCHYCGILETGRFNGLDRVDNQKGYTLENVVACCRWCNRAKGRNSVEEFSTWLEWVKGSKVREYLGTTGL
jgi:hypothetical protein